MSILLSIKPKYANKIADGEKKFEFRKTRFSKTNISYMYVYSTSPVKKIIGKILVDKILEGDPKEIWEICSEHSGITEDEYFEYYNNSKRAYALSIKQYEPLEESIDPYLIFDNFIPPQSFYYINEKQLLEIENY